MPPSFKHLSADPLVFHDLAEAYGWLNGQVNYERQLGAVAYNDENFSLEGFRRRMRSLGDPQTGLRTIHIAGTRGKGSAALTLEALLQAAGLRTAVYTSPHLREYRERIRIDGRIIGEQDFMQFLGQVAAPDSPPGTQEPDEPMPPGRAFKTVFEHLTALFFLAARRSGVDWVILETGLGGRLDATNIVDPGPVLLTRIGLEHTHLLGDTLDKIASEKAAILKPGGWAVVSAQDESRLANRVFQARAAQTGARLDCAADLCPIGRIKPHPAGLGLALDFDGRPLDLELGLYGDFQAENLQNALAMFSRLRAEGLVPALPPAELAATLERLRLPGRMEKVCDAPEIFADGGHCPTAASALARAMEQHFGHEPAGLIVGMMEDKDHDGFFQALARWPHWQWVWCYRASSPRAAEGAALEQVARRYFQYTRAYQDLEHILQSLPPFAEKKTRLVATGSLYSVARVEQWGWEHGSDKHQNKITPTPAE